MNPILDFLVEPGSGFYLWRRHQKNDGDRENIVKYFESIFDGAYKYKVSWLYPANLSKKLK